MLKILIGLGIFIIIGCLMYGLLGLAGKTAYRTSMFKSESNPDRVDIMLAGGIVMTLIIGIILLIIASYRLGNVILNL